MVTNNKRKKETYQEHQKLLSANQSGQQLTPASAS